MIDLALSYHTTTHRLVAGCDEVGRGCLAGPVVAAAVILPADYDACLLKDSKQLTPKQRGLCATLIREVALDWAIGVVDVDEVDNINVLNASHLAMHRAIDKLKLKPALLLIDGNRFKPYPSIKHQCIVKGDERNSSIAAASIIAKLYRDTYMEELAMYMPGYAWEHNKGYPSKAHRQAIHELGITKHHRKTFLPIEQRMHATLWGPV